MKSAEGFGPVNNITGVSCIASAIRDPIWREYKDASIMGMIIP